MVITDKNSTEWLKVKEFCTEQIVSMHEKLECDLGKKETAKLRGKIEFANMILNLDKVESKPDIPNTGYVD